MSRAMMEVAKKTATTKAKRFSTITLHDHRTRQTCSHAPAWEHSIGHACIVLNVRG